MADTTVSTVSGLNSALNTASPGDTIFLSPGTYSSWQRLSFDRGGWVYVRSLDPNNPAVFSPGIDVRSASKLHISYVTIDVTTATADLSCRIWDNVDLTFDHIFTHGDLSGDIASVINSVKSPWDTRRNTRLSFTNSEFRRLYNGIGNQANEGARYRGNLFHEIRCDGINGSGFTDLVVADNYFTDFYPQGDVGGDGDHPDAFQIFLHVPNPGSSDVLVENNKVVRGLGHQIQGISCFQEDATKFVTNITVKGNVLVGCSYNSIYVAGGINVAIGDNIVAPLPDEIGDITAADCAGVVITNNLTPGLDLTRSTSITNTGNTAGSWQTITPGDIFNLTRQQALSLQTVSTSETPASDVALATVDYRAGSGNTGSLVTTTISVDIAA